MPEGDRQRAIVMIATSHAIVFVRICVPTVGLFGTSDKYQYPPWGEKILALSTPETPESLMNKENFSHKNAANLMKTLTVKVVTLNTINFFNKYK